MEQETKFVTVYWSEQVWKRNTIEVRKGEEEEKIIEIALHYLGAQTIDNEVMRETIRIVEGLDLENE
jgi:hypothetical protein